MLHFSRVLNLVNCVRSLAKELTCSPSMRTSFYYYRIFFINFSLFSLPLASFHFHFIYLYLFCVRFFSSPKVSELDCKHACRNCHPVYSLPFCLDAPTKKISGLLFQFDVQTESLAQYYFYMKFHIAASSREILRFSIFQLFPFI